MSDIAFFAYLRFLRFCAKLLSIIEKIKNY